MEWKLPKPLAGIMPQSDPNTAADEAGAVAGAGVVVAVVEGGEDVLVDDPQAVAARASPAMTVAA
jgi:hypothetical protein